MTRSVWEITAEMDTVKTEEVFYQELKESDDWMEEILLEIEKKQRQLTIHSGFLTFELKRRVKELSKLSACEYLIVGHTYYVELTDVQAQYLAGAARLQ
jgi:DNA-binding transcriptional regulator WhiA